MGKRANGEGNVYQRANGTWEARMTYVDPETGERRRVSFYAKTAKAARGDEEGTRAGRRRCAGQGRQGVRRRLARTLARNDTRGVGSKGIDSRALLAVVATVPRARAVRCDTARQAATVGRGGADP